MISTFQLNNEVKIDCKELTVNLYKDILKATFGESPDPKNFVSTIINCLKETFVQSDAIDKLTIYDIFLIITHLRIQSMGPIATVSLANEEQKQLKLDLRLDWIIEDLQNIVNNLLPVVVSNNGVQIYLNTPTLTKLLDPTKDEYLYFLDKVNINNTTFSINTVQQSQSVFDKLPVKYSTEFLKKFQEFISNILEFDYLKRYEGLSQKLLLLPTLETLIWYCKIIFNESLETFYNNLFYLSKYANISFRDIERCNPGEYIFYVKKLEELAAQQNSDSATDQQVYGPEFDPMNDENFS